MSAVMAYEDGCSTRPAKRQAGEQQQQHHHHHHDHHPDHERDGSGGSGERDERHIRPAPDSQSRGERQQDDSGHGGGRHHRRRHHEKGTGGRRSSTAITGQSQGHYSNVGHHSATTAEVAAPALLPFNAQPLSSHKADYTRYTPLFASYLDLQKNLGWDGLDDREKKGRWKSFVKRWNAGQLAAGWYEPARLRVCQEEWQEGGREEGQEERARRARRANGHDETKGAERRHEARSRSGSRSGSRMNDGSDPGPPPPPNPASDDSSNESVGPALPGQDNGNGNGNGNNHIYSRKNPKPGPSIPTLDDLALQREASRDAQHADYADLHAARRADAKLQRTRLDELVPRADAGTRARQLEKKAEVNATMKAFRDRSPGAGMEVDESTLMGGGGDGVGELKQLKREEERKKSEREVRREEVRRAREVEREERLKGWREKEAGTMEMLKGLARERFG